MLKKVPNESSNTESSHTIEVNNKENSNTDQKQDTLINESTKGLAIVSPRPVFLSKFKQLIADMCEVTYDKKDITSMYRLGKKSDDNSRIQPVLIKLSNPSVKMNLIFKLKDSIYSISIDRTKEEHNAFEGLLKKKKELEQKGNVGGMNVHNKRPTMGSENHKTQSKTTLNNLSVNSCNLSVMYTNADNLINKRSELPAIISADNSDIICITETLLKHTHLSINECKLQVHDYNWFSNTADSNHHRGVVIYVKKFECDKFLYKPNRLKEYSCCKIVLKDNTILYIICEYRSPNSAIDNNDLLNQTIEDVSKLKGELLLLGDFNYLKINWEELYVSHTPEHCASKFFMATQNSFLLQHVSTKTHS